MTHKKDKPSGRKSKESIDVYSKEVLENGIVLVTEEVPHFRSVSVGFSLNVGSRYEQSFEMGVSHFLEHLLFRGTKNRTAKEISTAIDAVGGIINGSCGKEFTCFYAKVVDKDLPLALDVLSDMFLNSLFNPEDVEKERTVILEEIKSIEDSPGDFIFDLYMKTMMDDHPLAIMTSGDKDSVMHLKRDQILSYFYTNYVPSNIILSVAGNIKHHYVAKLLTSCMGKFKGNPVTLPSYLPSFKSRLDVHFKDCGQVHLCMGYPGISLKDDRRYTATILDNILGGTASSRLFQKIREDLGLVYTVYSFQHNFLDCGIFSFYAGMSLENIKQVIKIILNEIEDICTSGVTEQELQIAKDFINGNMILGLESTSNRMFRIAKSELVYNRLISVEEVLEKINLVTRDDVLELAHSIFDRNNLSICLLGPIDNNIDFSEFISPS
ncbi:MAG TPA: pitrilysin family protein [Candidatus Eremiobacteraeota bacterium]|nr:pitrilysin family protein [Candidatus Eremiobacteraeota bacterium]